MYKFTFFLTSVLVGGEWSAARSDRFTPGERTPNTHWIRGWAGSRTGLDDVEKILDPSRIRTLTRRPAYSQSLY
jgi:hypothetical protein